MRSVATLRRFSRLQAHTPLRRRTPMRQRSPKRIVTTPEDRDRLTWLHTLTCCAPGHRDCRPVEVHHNTQDRALGKKRGHDQGMPLCPQAHRDFHAGAGPFRGWTRQERREWQTEKVTVFQALWAVHIGTAGARCD